MSDPNKMPWLHLRGQFTYHGEALISGTTAGLVALRDAIDAAIKDREGEAIVYATDGEGYAVSVRRCSRLRDMGNPPYVDELARATAAYELDFVRKEERRNRDFWLERSNAIRKADYEASQSAAVEPTSPPA